MSGAKDAAVTFAVRHFLNARLEGIGEMTELSLDSAGRSAQCRLALAGEREPIDLNVRRYDLEHDGHGHWITIVDAVASRAWLTAALERFVLGRRFELPRKAALVL